MNVYAIQLINAIEQTEDVVAIYSDLDTAIDDIFVKIIPNSENTLYADELWFDQLIDFHISIQEIELNNLSLFNFRLIFTINNFKSIDNKYFYSTHPEFEIFNSDKVKTYLNNLSAVNLNDED